MLKVLVVDKVTTRLPCVGTKDKLHNVQLILFFQHEPQIPRLLVALSIYRRQHSYSYQVLRAGFGPLIFVRILFKFHSLPLIPC